MIIPRNKDIRQFYWFIAVCSSWRKLLDFLEYGILETVSAELSLRIKKDGRKVCMNIERAREYLLRHYEDILRQESIRLEELQATGLYNNDDRARDAGAQIVALRVMETERNIRIKIEDARRRIDSGTFGFCTLCGGEIAPIRLDAVPYEPLCIPCQNSQDDKRVVPKISTGLTQPAYW